RSLYIILVEIVPTMTSLLAASFLGLAVFVVGFAASLQFLGIGNSGELMWGTMLYNAQQAAALEAGNAWWALAPGAAVALLGVAFALLNYAFDEIGNPALRPVRKLRRPGVEPKAEAAAVESRDDEAEGDAQQILEVRDLSVAYASDRGDVVA